MLLQYLHVFIPVLGLMINILVQVGGFRYLGNLTLLKSVILGFGVGLISVIGCEGYVFGDEAVLHGELVPLMIVNLLIYSALGYCYFHFINLGETARRIRILRELAEVPEGLTLKEILDRYNARQIVTMRIHRLLHNHQIIEQDGRYYIGNPVMFWIATSMALLKWVIFQKTNEFN